MLRIRLFAPGELEDEGGTPLAWWAVLRVQESLAAPNSVLDHELVPRLEQM
jgi:hypothetical protein